MEVSFNIAHEAAGTVFRARAEEKIYIFETLINDKHGIKLEILTNVEK